MEKQSCENTKNIDWDMIHDEAINPEFLKNPYDKAPILRDIDLKNYNVDELEKCKQNFIQCFEHFFLYFLQSFDHLREKLRNDEKNKGQISWLDNLSKFIHNELELIQNSQMAYEFTSAWVLTYCLDYLMPNINIEQLKEKKDEIKSMYIEFIEEYLIELIACAQSEDFQMLQSIMSSRMGKFHEDHKNQFVRQSLTVCHDINLINDIGQDFPELHSKENNEHLLKSYENLQGHIEEQKTDFLQSSVKSQGFSYHKNVKKSFSASLAECQQCGGEHIQYQLIKAQIYLKSDKPLEAYLIVKHCQESHTLNKDQEQLIKQLLVSIGLKVESFNDPVQNLIYDIMKGNINQKHEIIKKVEQIQMTENDQQELKAWSLIISQILGNDIFKNQESEATEKQLSPEKQTPVSINSECSQFFASQDDQQMIALSIDGGGIRGIIQLIFLTEIEARTGKRIHELFNFFGGASIGALISVALSKGISAEKNKNKNIFIKTLSKIYLGIKEKWEEFAIPFIIQQIRSRN